MAHMGRNESSNHHLWVTKNFSTFLRRLSLKILPILPPDGDREQIKNRNFMYKNDYKHGIHSNLSRYIFHD